MDNTQHSKTKLYMAMELSAKDWKLRFTGGDKIRGRSVPAGQWEKLVEEINVGRRSLDFQPTRRWSAAKRLAVTATGYTGCWRKTE